MLVNNNHGSFVGDVYNYTDAVTSDLFDALSEYKAQAIAEGWTLENLEEKADELLTTDAVSGNETGSYYCNTWKAEEALFMNRHLLADALVNWFGDEKIEPDNAEAHDVLIRIYVGQSLTADVAQMLWDEIEEETEDEENA